MRDPIDRIAEWVQRAGALWIGAGAGLSAAAGLDFTDERSFAARYPGMLRHGFRRKLDLVGVLGMPEELTWGYYLSHVAEVRFGPPAPRVYPELLALARRVGEHFVATTNADGLFERHGFAPERLYTPQGDYARYQCLRPCSDETWPTAPRIEELLPLVDRATQELPPGRAPRCPRCGGVTFLNVRGGDWFVDAPYRDGARRANAWLRRNAARRLLVIEIGAGFNTPGWIRFPSERMVRQNDDARLVRVNRDHPEVPPDLGDRAIGVTSDAGALLAALIGVTYRQQGSGGTK